MPISPRSQKQLEKIRASTSYSVSSFRKLSEVYLDGCSRLIDFYFDFEKIEWLEKHLEFLEENKFIAFNSSLKELAVRKGRRLKEVEAAKTLSDSYNLFLYLSLENEHTDANEKMNELYRDLLKSLNPLLDAEKYLKSSKGPKINIYQAHTALQMIEFFQKHFDRIENSFELQEIFPGCYTSTKMIRNTSKANPLKMTLIGLNLLGYHCDERQLKDMLLKFEQMPDSLKTEEFIKSCRYYFEWAHFEFE